MCLAYVISAIAIVILIYIIMNEYKKGNEGFNSQWRFRNGNQWGDGEWCPPYFTYNNPACK